MEEKKVEEEIIKELKEEPKKDKKVINIKKEDRAYLYFRENKLGNLNIKFGPEKYTKDTSKFYDILMYGMFKGISFLSGLTKKEPIMKRREHYNSISTSLSAVVNEAFPDVYEMLKKEAEDEILAIQRAESGHVRSPEFEEKFEEAKEQLKERFAQKTTMTVSENNKKIANDIIEQIELFREVQDVMNKEWTITNGDEADLFQPKRVVFNLIESKIFDLNKSLETYYVKEEEQN